MKKGLLEHLKAMEVTYSDLSVNNSLTRLLKSVKQSINYPNTRTMK